MRNSVCYSLFVLFDDPGFARGASSLVLRGPDRRNPERETIALPLRRHFEGRSGLPPLLAPCRFRLTMLAPQQGARKAPFFVRCRRLQFRHTNARPVFVDGAKT